MAQTTSNDDAQLDLDGCELAELHCHLDGSLRATTFLDLYNQLDQDLRAEKKIFTTTEGVMQDLAFQSDWDLPRCLQSFATTLLVLQTPSNLERVAFEVCEDLHKHSNVTYAEIRYCPSLHRQGGMVDDDIIAAVHRGLQRAENTFPGCRFFQIVTILRDLGAEEGMVMAQLACKHGRSKLVVGVDLAGNEIAHPPEEFVEAFDYVHSHESQLGITIHAGEGSTDEAEKNIWTAVHCLHARRIGHGVAAKRSNDLLAVLRDLNIPIEICPSSNVHTGSISALCHHPTPLFVQAGVSVVPCCDNSLLSQTSTRAEYQHLAKHCQLSSSELIAIAKCAHGFGFARPRCQQEHD